MYTGQVDCAVFKAHSMQGLVYGKGNLKCICQLLRGAELMGSVHGMIVNGSLYWTSLISVQIVV